MATGLDCGWDTSDDEGGMQIDLDSQTEENKELNLGKDDVLRNGEHHSPNGSPGSLGQSVSANSSPSESSRTEQSPVKNNANISSAEDVDASADLTPASGDNEELKDSSTGGEGTSQLQAEVTQGSDCSNGELNDCWSSEVGKPQNGCSSSHGGENTSSERTSCVSPIESIGQVDEDAEQHNSGVVSGLSDRISSQRTEYKIKSPPDSLQTDEDTPNSIFVDSDISDGDAVVTNFHGGKEPVRTSEENDDVESSCKEDEDQTQSQANHQSEDSASKNKRRRHAKEREEIRRQEDVNACNEQVMVNLCRAESGSERIEDDVSRPKKKTRKKLTGKKLKKKEKKLRKDHSKKIKSKQRNEEIERDHRFVEIREDRTSVESKEEGELNGEVGNLVYRKESVEEVTSDAYEPALCENPGDELEDGQREPGEIVEEKKRRKKKDKKERKKKKRRRRVATIEEGSQGDDDVQKFPTFLDGFFVQNEEGEEEFDDGLDVPRLYDNDVQAYHVEDNFRRHHSSELRDNIPSFDHINSYTRSVDSRSEESEQRRGRRHDENGHESRGRRHHENARDVRHEQGHHFGSPRVRGREHGWDRERSRSERDWDRVRDNARNARTRAREYERDNETTWFRDRDRKRAEVDDRRRQHNRSNSSDNRQRYSTTERVSQATPRGSSSRHRHRSKSRERSSDRDRERTNERSKNRHQNRSAEREPARRVILTSHFHSQSPQNRNGKAGSDKENREERHRAEKVSEVSERDNSHHGSRRQRKDRGRRKSSSSSSTSGSDCVITYRNRNIFNRHHSSDDDDSSSDVILVESERVVINLVDEEEPPSRMDMTTQTITEDSGTMFQETESASPSLVSETPIDSSVIESNHTAAKVVENIIDKPNLDKEIVTNKEIVTTSAIDKPTKEVQIQEPDSGNKESDYDPAHPTEEGEELELRPASPKVTTISPVPTTDVRPLPPDHPPPTEARPSLPPVPSLMGTTSTIFQSQPQPQFASPRPHMALSSTFQEQPQPPLQHLPPLQPFPGLEQRQRFTSQPGVNGPNFNNLQLNNGLHPAFPSAQLGLRPIPDNRPMFPPQQSNLPFRSPLPNRSQLAPPREMPSHLVPPREMQSHLVPPREMPNHLNPPREMTAHLNPPREMPPHLNPPREMPPHLNPPREMPSQQMNIRYQMPITTMAPHGRPPFPSFDKSKMPISRFDPGMSQIFRPPLPMTSIQPSSTMYNPPPSRGCDLIESTEEVDMDMSPRDDNYGMEFLSPSSSDSDGDNNRKRGRKSDSHVGSSADKLKPSSTGKGTAAVHNASFSKEGNKPTAKAQVSSTSQKPKLQPVRKKRLEASDDDDLDDEDDVPTSAVDLTNKEKYMKKLHFQERVIDEVKMAVKPFYNSKKITKEQYKIILRKAVPKVCHSKSGHINPQRILHLVQAYVRKIIRGRASGGGSKKRKQHPQGLKDTTNPASRQNGGRAKNVAR